MKKKKLICGLLSASMVLTIGGLTSVYAADTETLADYPEYKEIVQKYYDGASAAWNISQFQENNLCYLAGYYSDINKLGYFLQDIDQFISTDPVDCFTAATIASWTSLPSALFSANL